MLGGTVTLPVVLSKVGTLAPVCLGVAGVVTVRLTMLTAGVLPLTLSLLSTSITLGAPVLPLMVVVFVSPLAITLRLVITEVLVTVLPNLSLAVKVTVVVPAAQGSAGEV